MAKARTVPNRSLADELKDARQVQAAALKRIGAIEKADKGKKVKPLTRARVAALGKLIAEVQRAGGAVGAGTSAVRTATSAEQKARAPLFELLTEIRADVEQSFPDDGALQKAFLKGVVLKATSTAALTSAAEVVVASWEDDTHAARAKDAGVTQKTIDKVSALSAALAAADSTQGERVTARGAAAGSKASGVAAMRREVAHVRKVVGRVFKKSAKDLAAFGRTTPRHAVKKRAPKTTAP